MLIENFSVILSIVDEKEKSLYASVIGVSKVWLISRMWLSRQTV
jgi:hypothetical protein